MAASTTTLPLMELLWNDLERSYSALPRALRERDPWASLPARYEALQWVCRSTGRDLRRALPILYWLRTDFVAQAQLWQQKAQTLPLCWQKLAQTDRAGFDAICRDVGAEMIAQAACLEGSADLTGWLAPLGVHGARRVVDRIAQREGRVVCESLARGWRKEYLRAIKCHRGSQIQAVLGQKLLAGTLRYVSEQDRSLLEVLLAPELRDPLFHQLTDLDLTGPQEVGTVQNLLNDVMDRCTIEQGEQKR